MDDLGRVVEQAADAVAAEIAHHAVTMRLGMLLDGVADVAEVIAGLRLIDADHQAFVGDVDQPLRLHADIADQIHPARIAVPAVRSEEHTSEHQSLMRISYAA